MTKKELKECAELAAEQITVMVDELKKKGFNEAQSIQLVTGMLSSSRIYMPFVDSIAEPTSQFKH